MKKYRLITLLLVSIVFVTAHPLGAADRTWDGGGANVNWSTITNWDGDATAPVANDVLFFGGSLGLINTNDFTAGTQFNGITFNSDAGAFVLRGNAINLGGDITNNSITTQTISLNLALTASRNFVVTTGGNLVLGGIVSGTTFGLNKDGAGTLTLSGANTFTGGATISAGTMVATVAGALGNAGKVIVNNGTLNLTAGAVTYTGLDSGTLSGNGVVNVTLGTGANSTILNGNFAGFTGTWNIGIGAAAGAGKVAMTGLDNAGATVNVLANGTLYVAAAVTKNAALVLNGGDTGESLGQLRLEGATWAGSVTLAGNITGGGDFTIGGNSMTLSDDVTITFEAETAK